MKLETHQRTLVNSYACAATYKQVVKRFLYFSVALWCFYLAFVVQPKNEDDYDTVLNLIQIYVVIASGVYATRAVAAVFKLRDCITKKNIVLKDLHAEIPKEEAHNELMQEFIDFTALRTRTFNTLDWLSFDILVGISFGQRWFVTAIIALITFTLAKILESVRHYVAMRYVQAITPDMILVTQNTEMHPYFEVKQELPEGFDWQPKIAAPLSAPETPQPRTNPFKRYKRGVLVNE